MNNHPQYKLGVRGKSPRGLFETFKLQLPPDQHVPGTVDYQTADMPPVWDQGDASDCVANATAAAIQFFIHKRHGNWMEPSRAAIYSQGKLLYEGADFASEGMYPASALQLVRDKGCVLEEQYPSTDANISYTGSLNPNLWQESMKIMEFVEVDNNPDAVMQALHGAGPVIFALDWANSFFNPNPDGTLPAYDTSAGGHCTLIVAGDKNEKLFRFRNSWSAAWGQSGYGRISFDQLQATALNCYTIRKPS